jgi:glycosyltransferase involved in cell wall biosynthesis
MNKLRPKNSSLILGIDAFNIRRGGGVTHLIELLRASNPDKYNFKEVILWGSSSTLKMVEDRDWLKKVHIPLLDYGFLSRIYWHKFLSGKAAINVNCDVVLCPGGTCLGGFTPAVTMSRNMLPFEWKELKRFGLSIITLKLLLLRLSQIRSFNKVDGLIFLTKYAFNSISSQINLNGKDIAIIPHGVNDKFLQIYKDPYKSEFTLDRPCKILYVSTISPYKHQCNVAKAVSILRLKGYPVQVDFVGSSDIGIKKINNTIKRLDPSGVFITYRGPIPHESLQDYYNDADIGVFASSCENMPNILLENMAAGLPIACSEMGPMPDILGKAGVYFDPLKYNDIEEALRRLIDSKVLRTKYAKLANKMAKEYSWKKCANQTFDYLSKVSKIDSN